MTCPTCERTPIDCYTCEIRRQAVAEFHKACERRKTARFVFDQKLWATGRDQTERAWQEMEASMRELQRAERGWHETSQALLALTVSQ